MKASGSPLGATAPKASRYRPASSAAIQRSSPPTRRRTARRSASSWAASRRVEAGEDAVGDLDVAQVAEAAQDVGQRVARVRAGAVGAVLEVELDLLERAGVDELAQLLLAEQLAQQLAVERQRRRAALGVRRVALVHVRGDVVEEQARGEGRRGRRLDLDHVDLAAVQPAQQLGQPRQVEHVAQALAVGLEDDRELRVAPRDLEQRLRLQPLLPQRRALARVGARDEQRARGVLAEARAEQRAGAELGRRRRPRARRVDEDEVGARRLVGVGEVDDDPVVGPDRVGLEAVLLADAAREREAPGGVDAPAVGLRTHSRQSPISSRKRSMTIVRSLGPRAWRPAARAGSRRGCARRARRGRSRARAPRRAARPPSG
jgi:hypothetical protein